MIVRENDLFKKLEILELVWLDFQWWIIKWLQLIESNWLLVVWTFHDGSCWFQSSVCRSCLWISPEGRYFKTSQVNSCWVSSFATRPDRRVLLDCAEIFLKKCMVNVTDYMGATWFWRLLLTARTELEHRCHDSFSFSLWRYARCCTPFEYVPFQDSFGLRYRNSFFFCWHD